MTKIHRSVVEQFRAHGRILVGDVRQKLSELPDASIDCVITSPPYFRLRNYQHEKQIGLENHVDAWVDELRVVAKELARVLKPTGSLWLNLGDTYSRHVKDGAARKSLLLAPERVALALQRDGWILRNKVIWAKPNPMPTSVQDRLSCTYEPVYFFTRSEKYFFDLDAVRVPLRAAPTRRSKQSANDESPSPGLAKSIGLLRGHAWSVPEQWRGPSSGSNSGLDRLKADGLNGHPLGKNPGDVWTIATAGFKGAHHAVFPRKLVETPLLATCPEKVCSECGTPWGRVKPTTDRHLAALGALAKSCGCQTNATQPGVVLDPFFGSGTVGIVAEQYGRDWIGVELNPEFAALAESRLTVADIVFEWQSTSLIDVSERAA